MADLSNSLAAQAAAALAELPLCVVGLNIFTDTTKIERRLKVNV